MTRPQPSSTRFPYTTLFRSERVEFGPGRLVGGVGCRGRGGAVELHRRVFAEQLRVGQAGDEVEVVGDRVDRKSTRLNSSHSQISYAVFCLKKKKDVLERVPG